MEEFFARNRLSAYLDGELPPAEARDVEQALEHNAELRAEYEALRRTIEVLRRGGPRPAPEGFAARLDARLRDEPMNVGWRRHLRRVRLDVVMLAAAAAVVLVVAGQKQDEPAAVPPTEAPPAAVDAAAAPAPLGDKNPDDKTQSLAEPSKGDGVLGNEPMLALPKPTGKVAPSTSTAAPERPPRARTEMQQKSKKSSSNVEKEAYVPEWEKDEPAAAAVPTQQAVYSAPAQYRVVVGGEDGLKDLAALAAALGGKLVDETGRPVAAYPMEPGDRKRVRLMVPAYNAGALGRKLEGLGDVEVLSDGGGLYTPEATVPVTIELESSE